MTPVAIYARFSTEKQRDASIDDQIRLCRERADREGWRVVDTFTDREGRYRRALQAPEFAGVQRSSPPYLRGVITLTAQKEVHITIDFNF
ncbi:recombinase family protein [Nitrobacter sp. TKz-YC01]|uniref:recombinase family protein n=1 Tax=Nitrobacter sp. TKz-YC01 TaxID=3398703 RepID=UPI003A101C93